MRFLLSPASLALLASCLLVPPAAAQTVPAGGAQASPALVRVLQSPASRKDKADALRQLAVVGTKEAVPVITPLLADPELSHMALYALRALPDPAVDEALRRTLGSVSGRERVGVIETLGARRDPRSTKPLAALLQDPDPDTAQGAARALGTLGTKDAAKALKEAVGKASAANQLAFCEGALRCAEALVAAGQVRAGLDLYEALRTLPTPPHQVRTATLRGVMLADSAKGVALLQASLVSDDYVQFSAAVRASMEMAAPAVTAALASALDRLSQDRQLVVIQALGQRTDAGALAALSAAARSGRKPSRLAALKALPELNQTATAAVFASLIEDPDSDIVQAAQDGLAAVPGAEVDSLVLRMLESPDARRRVLALELIGRRRLAGATPALLKATGDSEARVRTGAYRRLGELAEAKDAPALLERVLRAQGGPELEAPAQALAALAGRAAAPAVVTAPVLASFGQASVPQKAALLDVLATAGGADAFKVVRTAADSNEAALRGAALRALAGWRTAEAAPELLALAKASNDPTERLVCLRGYFAWASSGELPPAERLAMCRAAAAVVQQPDEKKLLLGAAGGVRVLEALELVTPHLADAAVKEEAAVAVASIGTEVVKTSPRPPQLADALRKASEATGDADLGRRLNALLQKAGQQ